MLVAIHQFLYALTSIHAATTSQTMMNREVRLENNLCQTHRECPPHAMPSPLKGTNSGYKTPIKQVPLAGKRSTCCRSQTCIQMRTRKACRHWQQRCLGRWGDGWRRPVGGPAAPTASGYWSGCHCTPYPAVGDRKDSWQPDLLVQLVRPNRMRMRYAILRMRACGWSWKLMEWSWKLKEWLWNGAGPSNAWLRLYCTPEYVFERAGGGEDVC